MEFLLILGCAVLMIVVLNKIGGLREQLEQLDAPSSASNMASACCRRGSIAAA